MPPARSVSNEAIWERLGALQKGLENIERELVEAREGRRAMYGKLEEQSDRINTVDRKVDGVVEDVREITPTVAEFKGLRAKAGGVVLVLVFIGSILTTLATLFIDQIKAVMGWK